MEVEDFRFLICIMFSNEYFLLTLLIFLSLLSGILSSIVFLLNNCSLGIDVASTEFLKYCYRLYK